MESKPGLGQEPVGNRMGPQGFEFDSHALRP